MDVNKPTLIATVVLVFVVGLIFGSFSGLSGTTGQVSRDFSSQIRVSPKLVGGGDSLTITVMPGSEGAERYVWFYDITPSGTLGSRKASSQQFCPHTNTCKETVTFSWRVPTGWQTGLYAATVTDVATGQKARADFRII